MPALKNFLTDLADDITSAPDGTPSWLFINLSLDLDCECDEPDDDAPEPSIISMVEMYITPRKTLHAIDVSDLGPALFTSVDSADLTMQSVLERNDVGKVFLTDAVEATGAFHRQLGIKLGGIPPIGYPADQRPDCPMPPLQDLLDYFQHVLGGFVNEEPINDSTVAFLRDGLRAVSDAESHEELDRLSAALSDMTKS